MKHSNVLRAIWGSLALLAAIDSSAAADGCTALAPKDILFGDAACATPLQTRHVFKLPTDSTKPNRPFDVYYCSKVVTEVLIKEEKRKTRLAADFEAVLKNLSSTLDLTAQSVCTQYSFSPALAHSTLTVIAKGPDAAQKIVELKKQTVISGLKEHWYLGLDLPVTSKKTLKYDNDSGTLKPSEENPQLYLSFNYQFGDVFNDPNTTEKRGAGQRFSDRITLKMFISASKKPLDSVGAGIGYRLPDWKIGGAQLKDLSIYAGHFWTKQDDLVAGEVVKNGSHDKQWRFGVTFDVQSMLKSVKW